MRIATYAGVAACGGRGPAVPCRPGRAGTPPSSGTARQPLGRADLDRMEEERPARRGSARPAAFRSLRARETERWNAP